MGLRETKLVRYNGKDIAGGVMASNGKEMKQLLVQE